MMIYKLTTRRINDLYDKQKKKAHSAYNRHNYSNCLKHIKAAAHTAYSFYLGYKDDELEVLLSNISHYIYKRTDNHKRAEDECVIYDSFAYDNGGLVQQYLAAIMSCGYKILYLSERNYILDEKSAIGEKLRKYGRADLKVVPGELSYMDRSQFIYDTIMSSNASKLFMHISPSASYACCAFYALPSTIIKYQINLTDHTYWLGSGIVDFSFEFRPYGCNLSIYKRGIDKRSILYMPFYPILDNRPFEGFPDEAKDKIILLSGGSYYKIFDKEDTFFKISKAALDAVPKLIILFAGDGDKSCLQEKLKEFHIEDRFIPIGKRSDITEVFKHCDIYMNTYPVGGGLMAQYAAQLGKPIVSYCQPGKSKVEEFVCQVRNIVISIDNLKALTEKIQCLCENYEYRATYGKEIRNCVLTPEEFFHLFGLCMRCKSNQIPFIIEKKFTEHVMKTSDKLDLENNTKDFQRTFVKIFGVSALWKCPLLLLNAIVSIIKDNRFSIAIKNHITS